MMEPKVTMEPKVIPVLKVVAFPLRSLINNLPVLRLVISGMIRQLVFTLSSTMMVILISGFNLMV